MDYVGIDVQKKPSQICPFTAAGEMLHQRIATQRERCAAVCTTRPQVRLLIEASTASAWVAQCLAALGHEVIVADPHDAPLDAQRRRRVKTDRRDAEALAQACRLGAYRPAHRTSERQRQVRAVRTVREAVGQSRTRWLSVVRALRRHHGSRLRRGATESCRDRVAALARPAELQAAMEPLVRAMQSVNAPLAAVAQRTATLAQAEEVVERWRTAPGVGPLTARSCVATLDAVERFDHAHQVESSRGLVPREWSAGEQQQRGTMTKHGRGQRRALVVGAAWRIWRRHGVVGSTLRHGAEPIAARRGKRIAVVALARRLAGIRYALWRAGSVDDAARVGQRQRAVALTVSSPKRRDAPEPRCAAGWSSPGAVRASMSLAAVTAVGEMAPRPDVSP
jgi:transposase